jgi:hypothetical protein
MTTATVTKLSVSIKSEALRPRVASDRTARLPLRKRKKKGKEMRRESLIRNLNVLKNSQNASIMGTQFVLLLAVEGLK